MKNIEDKENLGFDRLVKTLLEDAAEPVPEGVWKAVSGALAAKRAAALRRRFMVAVASAAAVVALAFVLLRPSADVATRVVGTDVTAESGSDTSIQNTYTDFSVTGSGEAIAEVMPSLAHVQPAGPAAAETPDIKEVADVAGTAGDGHCTDAGSVSGAGSVFCGEDVTVGGSVSGAGDVFGSEDVSGSEDGDSDADGGVSADAAGDEASGAFAGDADAASRTGAYVRDPFAQDGGTLGRKTRRPVTIKAGGSLMTNGNPSSLSYKTLSRQDSQYNSGQTVSQTSKDASYSVPVSVGIGVDVPLRGKWSIGSGISYSFLERTFKGTYTDLGAVEDKVINTDIRHSVHYVGIPLNLCYNLMESRNITLRTHAGVKVEKAVQERFRIPDGSEAIFVRQQTKGVQISAAAGFSVDFLIGDVLGFYIDPSLQYFFDCGQPVSIRTQQPLQMGLELGLRFNL